MSVFVSNLTFCVLKVLNYKINFTTKKDSWKNTLRCGTDPLRHKPDLTCRLLDDDFEYKGGVSSEVNVLNFPWMRNYELEYSGSSAD